MISFACSKCSKRQRRPDAEAGSYIFCECGQGNRVPWPDATTTDAEPVDVVRPYLPKIEHEDLPEPIPVPAARPRNVPEAREANRVETPPPPTIPSKRSNRLPGKVNPAFCFHHDEKPSEITCSACRLPFCGDCIVLMQGQELCGPCKNFRIAARGQPRRTLPLAVFGLVVSLVGGPVTFILSMVAAGLYLGEGFTAGAVVLCLLGLVLPITGLILSRRALHHIETRPRTDGQALAASGACAALMSVLWSLTVVVIVVCKAAMER